MKVSRRSTTRIAAWLCILSLFTLLPNGLAATEPRLPDARDRIAVPPGSALSLPDEPIATFKGVTLEHGLRINGHNGFRVHSHVIITGRLNITCFVEAYFFDADGKMIEAATGSPNADSKNNAMVTKTIKPNYSSTEYNDVPIFVPTTTFHALAKGSHDITVRVYVVSEDKVIGYSDDNAFVLTL